MRKFLEEVAGGPGTICRLRDELFSAFEVVAEAEAKGGNVANLVVELNMIIPLLESTSEDDFSELLNRILTVSQDAVLAGNVGESTGMNQFYVSITVLLVTCLLVVLIWVFTPVVYWKLWLRSKKGWVVYS